MKKILNIPENLSRPTFSDDQNWSTHARPPLAVNETEKYCTYLQIVEAFGFSGVSLSKDSDDLPERNIHVHSYVVVRIGELTGIRSPNRLELLPEILQLLHPPDIFQRLDDEIYCIRRLSIQAVFFFLLWDGKDVFTVFFIVGSQN